MYTEEMRKASLITTDKEAFKQDDSDGDQKHRELLDKIKTNYKEYFELRSQQLQSSREKIGDRFDPVEPLTKKDNDTQKKFEAAAEDIIGAGKERKFKKRGFIGTFTDPVIEIPQTDTGIAFERFEASPTRTNALAYLRGLEQLKKDNKITKEAADLYDDYIEIMRTMYGYSDISEVPKGTKLPLTVPYWSNENSVRRYMKDAIMEYNSYERQKHTTKDIDKYPKLAELLTKLGIAPDVEILSQFYETQRTLLGGTE